MIEAIVITKYETRQRVPTVKNFKGIVNGVRLSW